MFLRIQNIEFFVAILWTFIHILGVLKSYEIHQNISYHDILWNEYSFILISNLILNFEYFFLPFISLSSISISQSCEFSGESFIISSVSSITGETELFWRINWFDLFINCCWSFSACIASFSDHSWHNRLISNWRKPTFKVK